MIHHMTINLFTSLSSFYSFFNELQSHPLFTDVLVTYLSCFLIVNFLETCTWGEH